MDFTARDIMVTRFATLHPQTSLAEAVKIFDEASRDQKQQVFGIIVTDDDGRLIGMISMYDILLLMRPKHIHIWGEMRDIDVRGFVDETCRRSKSILVGDIMSTDVVTVSPDTHLLMIVDIMLKKHIRRLPVVEDGKVVGIVYISKVFSFLMNRLNQ
jgi:CBS domain-containing protein